MMEVVEGTDARAGLLAMLLAHLCLTARLYAARRAILCAYVEQTSRYTDYIDCIGESLILENHWNWRIINGELNHK